MIWLILCVNWVTGQFSVKYNEIEKALPHKIRYNLHLFREYYLFISEYNPVSWKGYLYGTKLFSQLCCCDRRNCWLDYVQRHWGINTLYCKIGYSGGKQMKYAEWIFYWYVQPKHFCDLPNMLTFSYYVNRKPNSVTITFPLTRICFCKLAVYKHF